MATPDQVLQQALAWQTQVLNTEPTQQVQPFEAGNLGGNIGLANQGLTTIANALLSPSQRTSAAEQKAYERNQVALNREVEQARLDQGYSREQELLQNQQDFATERDAIAQRGRVDLANLDAELRVAKPNTYTPVKDTDGNVIGSFNVNTGDQKLYDSTATEGDTIINPDTGYDTGFSKVQVQTAQGASDSIQSINPTLELIESFTIDNYMGASGLSSYAPDFAIAGGTDASAKFGQLAGAGFLENIGSFEGKGALSDSEGKAIRQAYSGIFDEDGVKSGISEDEFYNQTQIIRQNLQISKAKSQKIESIGRKLTSKEAKDIADTIKSENPIKTFDQAQADTNAANRPQQPAFEPLGSSTPTGLTSPSGISYSIVGQ